MTKTWIKGCAVAAVLAGAACGTLREGNLGVAVATNLAQSVNLGGDSLAQPVSNAGSQPAPAASSEQVLDRAFIEAQNIDLLRVSIISRDVTTLVPFAAQNGDKTTWISSDQISLSYKGGLLIGSRGLGDDLMGADVSGALTSLSAGGNHMRTLDFLNGLDQIDRKSFQCETVQTGSELLTIFEISYQTDVFDETCVGESETFKNTYWRDADGVIWQSRQWISPMVGYLGYQRL